MSDVQSLMSIVQCSKSRVQCSVSQEFLTLDFGPWTLD